MQESPQNSNEDLLTFLPPLEDFGILLPIHRVYFVELSGSVCLFGSKATGEQA
jgi:hypothetical protein